MFIIEQDYTLSHLPSGIGLRRHVVLLLILEKIGSEVDLFKVGDRVSLMQAMPIRMLIQTQTNNATQKNLVNCSRWN